MRNAAAESLQAGCRVTRDGGVARLQLQALSSTSPVCDASAGTRVCVCVLCLQTMMESLTTGCCEDEGGSVQVQEETVDVAAPPSLVK